MKTPKLEVGKTYKNKYGQFTKVTEVKDGFVYFSGWHVKESEAAKRLNANGHQPLNVRAFGRLLDGKAAPAAASTTNGNGVSNERLALLEQACELHAQKTGEDAPVSMWDGVSDEDITARIEELEAMDDAEPQVQASDVVKAYAAENNIDLATVTGTGANGNIIKKDVEAAIAAKAK